MIIYRNNCNSGCIHRNVQKVASPDDSKLEPNGPVIIPLVKRKRPFKGWSQAVIRIEDWKLYPTRAAAKKDNHIGDVTLDRALAYPSETAGGYHWRYA